MEAIRCARDPEIHPQPPAHHHEAPCARCCPHCRVVCREEETKAVGDGCGQWSVQAVVSAPDELLGDLCEDGESVAAIRFAARLYRVDGRCRAEIVRGGVVIGSGHALGPGIALVRAMRRAALVVAAEEDEIEWSMVGVHPGDQGD